MRRQTWLPSRGGGSVGIEAASRRNRFDAFAHVALIIAVATGAFAAHGAPMADGPPAFSDRDDGISCPFFDVGLGASWAGNRPNWTDADGLPNGPLAYASQRIQPGDPRRVRRVDVTRLAQAWWSGRLDNQGMLVRVLEGDTAVFHSRETADPALRPQLLVHGTDGKSHYLEPAADATLDCSTYRGLGRLPTLVARRDTWVALRFDLGAVRAATPVPPASVELILVRAPNSPTTGLLLAVFALQSPLGTAGTPREDGIASRYREDVGIERDPDVLFADGFEGHGIDRRWTVGMKAKWEIVETDPVRRFEPLSGHALRVTIPRGQSLGLDIRYRLRDRDGVEPEEIYFRYYLRLARSWLSAAEGGKLPGLAGTYGRAGWGGRQWDGKQGWSTRGSYNITPADGHAATGRVMLGTYAYHSKSEGTYGEVMPWIKSGLAGLIEPDRWYCIEQRVKLNAPGRDDGVLQTWIDGRLALSREDLRLRDLPGIRIEEVWMNFFHGGTQVAPADMNAYVDNVVVARRYIGVMAR